MKFAKWVFILAAVWGVLTVPPLYFAEGVLEARYGPLFYPEWYYGMIAIILVFQLLYLLIGLDPARLRPVMPVAILGKVGFASTLWTLYALGRTPLQTTLSGSPDLIWAVFFVIAYVRTRPTADPRPGT
jgi:predicted membrane metal-binding protein